MVMRVRIIVDKDGRFDGGGGDGSTGFGRRRKEVLGDLSVKNFLHQLLPRRRTVESAAPVCRR